MAGSAAWVAGVLVSVVVAGGGVAWTVEDAHQSVSEWGAGVVDHPIDAPPYDPVLHRYLVFDLDDVMADSPAAISGLLTQQVEWWRRTTNATIILAPPYADGARMAVLSMRPGDSTRNACSIGSMAHPVACPDPAEGRDCYHLVANGTGTEVHVMLTLEHDGVDVELHADGLLLFNGDTIFRAGDGPLSKLNGESIHTALVTLAMATDDADFIAPGSVRRWAIEGHAHATLNVGQSLQPCGRAPLARDVSAVAQMRANTRRRRAKRRPQIRRTGVEKWRKWNAPLLD